MANEYILVVEDEDEILELLRYNLERAGYRVRGAQSGEAALQAAGDDPPDLVLLDLMLPAMDGFEVCKRLKGDVRTRHVPVLMLTARGEDADIVAGLELGADDYLTKPFSPRVLLARIKAVLRRQTEDQAETDEPLTVGDLRIHPGRHEVTLRKRPVELTVTEFRVLSLLARHPGWVYTRQQIVDAVRGAEYAVTDRSVDVQIAGLRRKLGAYGDSIQTVRGVGYRFRD